MSLPNINLVIIGHKDHGKSTLIGRLLYDSKAIPEQKIQEIKAELDSSGKGFKFAYLLDSLEEEREGGLTIDIMQTPFRSERYIYTIIDCPGHREFIQKMLTGASQADAAILVVSAKEGVEEQTKQHLYLIKTLGIKQLIVALNKMDTVSYDETRFKELSKEINSILSSLGYDKASIIPVSATSGDNIIKKSAEMKWYKGKTLIEALDSTVKPPKPPIEKPLRACVQDIYELEGENIIICKVETGTLTTGRSVICLSSGEKGIIKRIESLGAEVQEAKPEESVGLIIEGISDIKRGDILAYPEEESNITKEFTAELIIFSDITLRRGDIVTIRVGTAEKKCKIQDILEKIDPVTLSIQEEKPETLKNGEVGKITFKPIEPLYLDMYSIIPQLGRFVIIGEKGAVAAGIVLEKN